MDINSINDYFLSMNQNIRIIEYVKRPEFIKFNSGLILYKYEIRKLKRYLNNEKVFEFNINFFDDFYKIFDDDEYYNKLKKFNSSNAGKRAQEKYGPEYFKINLNVGVPWNKGLHGIQSAWNKNLTKNDHNSLMNLSKKYSGSGNPFYGKKHSDATKIAESNFVKNKILNGIFTPKTNNRRTFWTSVYNGKTYRSSWESAFQYLNKECVYEKIRIPYNDGINKRVYIVDFVDFNNKILYEIKPKSLICKDRLKIESGYKWAEDNSYTFVVISEDYFKSNIEQILNSDLSDNDKRKLKVLK